MHLRKAHSTVAAEPNDGMLRLRRLGRPQLPRWLLSRRQDRARLHPQRPQPQRAHHMSHTARAPARVLLFRALGFEDYHAGASILRF